jgi:predicted RNA binding protein YcfA (HicA-like mRNA interferase family)
MPKLGPISRKDLIKNLRKLGFEGPESGGNHQYMFKADLQVIIPNPHKGDIGAGFLNRILKQADILRSDWEKL